MTTHVLTQNAAGESTTVSTTTTPGAADPGLVVRIAGEATVTASGDVSAQQYAYNGAAWERVATNQEGVLLASAARTATTSSATQTNATHRGVIVFFNVSAAPGGDTVTARIEAQDPATSNWYTIVTDTAVSTTTGRRILCYPGASDSGSQFAAKNNVPLPRTWRLTVAHSATGSFTYSAGMALLV